MTEIETLAVRIRDLGQSVDGWNTLMIWGLALAAVAAVIIGISTRMVVVRSGQQSDAQSELMHARDAQFAVKLEEAHKAASEVGVSLEKEKQNTARFQKEADEARLALENRVRTQGPRYALLRANAPRLAKELSKFSGQRVTMRICGLYKTERETLETWGSLASTLGIETVNGIKGAGWEITPGTNIWERCGLSMQGISVIISPESQKIALDAANALSEALASVLPPYNKNPWVVDVDFAHMKMTRGISDATEPERIALDNPGTIVVFIGEHPPI